MEKVCASCQVIFNCNATAVATCHCYGIELASKTRETLQQKFTDCLCQKCLTNLANQPLNEEKE